MATKSTALVPLGDRDYIAKMTNQGTPDDLLALVTTKEAKALSDVALVTKVEAQGEVWHHVRTYINEWLVGRFPVFDELAIRIADRKRKGMSPLIIKSQPCDSFKRAIRLILECDPSYYFKIRKKHLGGGWQKALPAEATAPDKAEVAETSVTDIKVDEPDAKDAEVCDPDPVPMPSDETVDKVHSTGTTVTDITTGSPPRTDGMDETAAQSVAVVATKLAKMIAEGHGSGKAAKGLAREIVEVDKDKPFLPTIVTLESNLHVVIRAWKEFFSPDKRLSESDKQRLINQFVRAMSEDDFKLLCNSVIGRKKKEGKVALNAYSAALATQEEPSVAAAGSPEVPEASQEAERQDDITGFRQHIVDGISNDSKLDAETKAAALEKIHERWAKLDAKRAGDARAEKVLAVLKGGKSLGRTQVLEEVQKANPDWENFGSLDEWNDTIAHGLLESRWFKRGSLYNIAPAPPKKEKPVETLTGRQWLEGLLKEKTNEAAAPQAAAASAPEPSDAELAQQALDFVQRVTQPSGEQEAE